MNNTIQDATSSNIHIALVGKPNCGKTSLFNRLTGSRQKVANYPGVTVERKHGALVTTENKSVTLIDLPGIYTLRPKSLDEQVSFDILFNQSIHEAPIDAIIAIADATNLNNSLRLILELKHIGLPIIVALNMIDIAKARGIRYDIAKLSELLDLPVVEISATKKIGIEQLTMQLNKINKHNTQLNTYDPIDSSTLETYQQQTNEIIKKVQLNQGKKSHLNYQIDKILLNPVLGLLILLAILFTVFQTVFSWAEIPKEAIEDVVNALRTSVININPNSLLINLIANGIIAGIGAIIVFLPQILSIYLFIILLEDSGYMARAAFLLDRLMGRAGLNGRAFIPLLSSFACAIPGIMATRTIENRNDRLITILISPLMTCSARIPVYTLLISAFIPVTTVWGIFNLQGLVMFGLYLSGMIFGLIMAFIFKKFVYKGNGQILMLELPSYKLPTISNVLIGLINPLKAFINRAGTIILAIMIILWALATFPQAPTGAIDPVINYSFAGIIGKFLEPIFAPIGFNWQIVVALIPGMAAREVAVSALATVYAISQTGDELSQSLSLAIQHNWSLATGLSFIAWYVFAPQCISTLAAAKRETNSWRIPIIMFSYQIALAYGFAFIVFRLTNYLIN